jgi:hypothetical protein
MKILYKRSGCGGIIDLAAGQQNTIKSPNYPNIYSVNKECVWMIRVSQLFTDGQKSKDASNILLLMTALMCR